MLPMMRKGGSEFTKKKVTSKRIRKGKPVISRKTSQCGKYQPDGKMKPRFIRQELMAAAKTKDPAKRDREVNRILAGRSTGQTIDVMGICGGDKEAAQMLITVIRHNMQGRGMKRLRKLTGGNRTSHVFSRARGLID